MPFFARKSVGAVGVVFPITFDLRGTSTIGVRFFCERPNPIPTIRCLARLSVLNRPSPTSLWVLYYFCKTLFHMFKLYQILSEFQ